MRLRRVKSEKTTDLVNLVETNSYSCCYYLWENRRPMGGENFWGQLRQNSGNLRERGNEAGKIAPRKNYIT